MKRGAFNVYNLSDLELAESLHEWMGDAANSWDDFSDKEKSYFRRLEAEACRRFIDQHMEAADGND